MLNRLRPRWSRLAPTAVLLLVLAVVAASCSGDDDDGDDADGVAGGSGARPLRRPAAAPAATATGDGARSPADLTSYRYDITVEVSGEAVGGQGAPSGLSLDLDLSMEISGAFIAPDREQTEVTADLGFIQVRLETIRIGSRSWMREPGGEWEEQAAIGDGLGLDFAISPIDLFGGDLGDGLGTLGAVVGNLDGTPETVNGVDALRYELTANEFARAFPDSEEFTDLAGVEAAGVAGDFTTTIWVARDSGIPVRLVLDGSSTVDGAESSIHVELNLRDVNSDDITIEPPA